MRYKVPFNLHGVFMLQGALKEQITKACLQFSQQLPAFTVETTKTAEHGDFATNIAMLLTKELKKPPRQIAEDIVKAMQLPNQLIHQAEIAGPGFINFWLQEAAVLQVIPAALEQSERYGYADKPNEKRVLIEFVSANPTGPLHLGHARSAFTGDAVARLLRAAGYEVTTEYYINDVGNQIVTLGKSIYARYKELHGEKIVLEKDAYPAPYVIDIARVLQAEDKDRWLGAPEEEWLPRCIEVGIRENLKDIQAVLKTANITIDNWYSEATLHERHLIEKLISDYRSMDMLYEASMAVGTEDKVRRVESKSAQYVDQQKGGTFLKTKQFGDEEDRIVLRADGRPVYLVADLAYHQEKYARHFDVLIDVFGADHAGHLPRLRAGMRALSLPDSQLEFLIVQMVRLLRDGEEVRFSKRTGQIYLLEDLLEEVGSDVARSIFLIRAPTTQFDFDLQEALQESSDNPVFYVQYGHARMATLLRKAAESGQPFHQAGLTVDCLARLVLKEELALVKKMSLFPDMVQLAAAHREPHRILHYCHDLIGDFHAYFSKYRHSERIISDDGELTQARLAMVAALKQTLANALAILGISAPESMYTQEV